MRIIDDTVGQTFDMLLEDFDNDGRIDFLLTSFDDRIGVKSGSVYIYEIPDDVLYEIFYLFNLYVSFFTVSCIFFLIVTEPGFVMSLLIASFQAGATQCLLEHLSLFILVLRMQMKFFPTAGKIGVLKNFKKL